MSACIPMVPQRSLEIAKFGTPCDKRAKCTIDGSFFSTRGGDTGEIRNKPHKSLIKAGAPQKAVGPQTSFSILKVTFGVECLASGWPLLSGFHLLNSSQW